jgi:peptidase E
MAVTRHIVAMGGGGFSEEPDNPLLDDYVLALVGKDRPKICFLPTASGDAEGYIERFREAFPKERARASVFTLFTNPRVGDFRDFLLDQDVIYVGGGSTVNMLAVWAIHGIDRILREAWEGGVVLAGLSAGMNCWFQSSVTDSMGGAATALKAGLEFLEGSACPHYDSELERRPAFHELVGEGELPPGIAADDGAAFHFVGTEIEEIVSSRPTAYGYRVEMMFDEVKEFTLPTRFLG